MEHMHIVTKACEVAGGQAELSRSIGVSPSAIQQWRTGFRQIPVQHCSSVESATSGAVTVEELRPDALWQRIPDATWPHPDGRPLLDFAPDRPTEQEVGNV